MGLPTKGVGSPLTSWTYEGDVIEAAKWLPYAIGLLRAYASKGIAKGNNNPEDGVAINFDAMTGRIHIKAGTDVPYIIMVHPDSVGDRAGDIPVGAEGTDASPYNYKTRVRYKKVTGGMQALPHYYNDTTIIKDSYYAGNRYWFSGKNAVSWRKYFIYAGGRYKKIENPVGVGGAMVLSPAQRSKVNTFYSKDTPNYVLISTSTLSTRSSYAAIPRILALLGFGNDVLDFGEMHVLNETSNLTEWYDPDIKKTEIELFSQKGTKFISGHRFFAHQGGYTTDASAGDYFQLQYYNLRLPGVNSATSLSLFGPFNLFSMQWPKITSTYSGSDSGLSGTMTRSSSLTTSGKYLVHGGSAWGQKTGTDRFYFLYAEPSKLTTSGSQDDTATYNYVEYVSTLVFGDGGFVIGGTYTPSTTTTSLSRVKTDFVDNAINIKLGYVDLDTETTVYSVVTIASLQGFRDYSEQITHNDVTLGYPLASFSDGTQTHSTSDTDKKRSFVLLAVDYNAQVFVWAVYDVSITKTSTGTTTYHHVAYSGGYVNDERSGNNEISETITVTTTIKVRSPAGEATLDSFVRTSTQTYTTANVSEIIHGVALAGSYTMQISVPSIIPIPRSEDVDVWGADPVISTESSSLYIGIKNKPNCASNGKYLTYKYFVQRGTVMSDSTYTLCVDTLDIQNAATVVPTRVLAEHTFTTAQVSRLTDHAVSLTM